MTFKNLVLQVKEPIRTTENFFDRSNTWSAGWTFRNTIYQDSSRGYERMRMVTCANLTTPRFPHRKSVLKVGFSVVVLSLRILSVDTCTIGYCVENYRKIPMFRFIHQNDKLKRSLRIIRGRQCYSLISLARSSIRAHSIQDFRKHWKELCKNENDDLLSLVTSCHFFGFVNQLL